MLRDHEPIEVDGRVLALARPRHRSLSAVVYVLDGEEALDFYVDALALLVAECPGVAAVAVPHGPDRDAEYGGDWRETARWLTRRVAPAIDEAFGSRPARQVVAGASLGGLAALLTVATYSRWTAAVSMSPSLGLELEAARQWRHAEAEGASLYVDHGGNGHDDNGWAVEEFCRELRDAGVDGRVRRVHHAGQPHSWSSWRWRLSEGVRWVLTQPTERPEAST